MRKAEPKRRRTKVRASPTFENNGSMVKITIQAPRPGWPPDALPPLSSYRPVDPLRSSLGHNQSK
jgi:hypothetical protein